MGVRMNRGTGAVAAAGVSAAMLLGAQPASALVSADLPTVGWGSTTCRSGVVKMWRDRTVVRGYTYSGPCTGSGARVVTKIYSPDNWVTARLAVALPGDTSATAETFMQAGAIGNWTTCGSFVDQRDRPVAGTTRCVTEHYK